MSASETPILTDDVVLARRDCVVVRPQRQGYVLYNSRSDELHLVTRDGQAVFMLCDGWRTAGDIVAEVACASPEEPERVRASVLGFLQDLQRRGLVERTDA